MMLRPILRLVGLATIRHSRTLARVPQLLCSSHTACVVLLNPPERPSQTYLDTGRAHAQHTQNLVFDRLKGAPVQSCLSSRCRTATLLHTRVAAACSGEVRTSAARLAVIADGVHWVMANQEVSFAAAAVTALAVVPGTLS